MASAGLEDVKLSASFQLHYLSAGFDKIDPLIGFDGGARESIVRQSGLGAVTGGCCGQSAHRVTQGIPPASIVKVFEIRMLIPDGEINEQLSTLEMLAGAGAVMPSKALNTQRSCGNDSLRNGQNKIAIIHVTLL